MARGSTEVLGSPVDAIEAMGDSYSLDILSALSQDSMSVKKLSEQLDVPIATAYRRVEELEETGLLECEGKQTNEDGRKVKVYRSRVDEIHVSFVEGSPHVEMETKSEARKSIDDAWRRLREEGGG